jgi:hypothetical protein
MQDWAKEALNCDTVAAEAPVNLTRSIQLSWPFGDILN